MQERIELCLADRQLVIGIEIRDQNIRIIDDAGVFFYGNAFLIHF